MTSYRPDPRILTLGPDFYDPVEPASFPQCTPRFLNHRWAERVGLELNDEQWADYKAGKLYVNVHSEQHKPGEIRGQLKT